MKSTYLYLSLALISLALLTSCGPDANKPTPEVTALTLSATTANLSVDETLQLTASVTPADAKVTFTTDNAAVATVCEKGVVKAIAPGTATITAQAGDKKATCTVTVGKRGATQHAGRQDVSLWEYRQLCCLHIPRAG